MNVEYSICIRIDQTNLSNPFAQSNWSCQDFAHLMMIVDGVDKEAYRRDDVCDMLR